MLNEKTETNDINIQIRGQRKESLKDAAARTVLLLALAWFTHLIFSAWSGGLWANPLGANLFTLGVTILIALCFYVPLWRDHVRTMKHLKETRRRLKMAINVPKPY